MNNNDSSIQHLIIDWGTSNFRLFAINNEGKLVKKMALGQGLLQLKEGDFETTLHNILSSLSPAYQRLPIFMAGMVGSLSGWHNVPYVNTPVSKALLATNAFSFDLPWPSRATIIPGVSHQNDEGNYDVMRGEEVQIFGLAKLMRLKDFHAILPGTHSKHAIFEADKLKSFQTYMTGELFSVISHHTILGKNLVPQESNENIFIEGVQASQKGQITNVLFSARSQRLFNQLDERYIHDFISGLLVGYELKYADKKHLYIIGGNDLSMRYKTACEQLSIKTTIANGDECFIAGMQELITQCTAFSASVKHP